MANDFESRPSSVMIDPSKPLETPDPVWSASDNDSIEDGDVTVSGMDTNPGTSGNSAYDASNAAYQPAYDTNSTGTYDTNYSPNANAAYDDTPPAGMTFDRGIDHNSEHDPSKGAVIGAIGGAVVGGFAGGPAGAVVGAVAGAVASGAGVAAVDEHDDDDSPREKHIDPVTGDTIVVNTNGLE